MRYLAQLLKGSTDILILSLLRQEPMYGYQIIKELERRSGGYLQFREGTLYPALHRLESDGLIRGRWQRLANGQERRYYTLTRAGERYLGERVPLWQGFARAVETVIQPS